MNRILFIFSLCLLVFGLGILIFETFFAELLISFVSDRFSADGVLSDESIIRMHLIVFSWDMILVCCGTLLFIVSKKSIRVYAKRVLLEDKLADYSGFFAPKFVFVLSTALSLILSSLHFFIDAPALNAEDGFLENMTAVLFLGSAGIFLASARSLQKGKKYHFSTTIVRSFLIFASIGCFLVAMEEISWGQRIFGLATPELIAEKNYQKELNIHNLFNPILVYFYFALIPCILISSILSLKLNENDTGFCPTGSLIVPHPSLIPAMLMICVNTTLVSNGELIEQLLSVMSVFYAMRIRKVMTLSS